MDPRVAQLQQRAAQRSDIIQLAGGLPADELLPRVALSAVLSEAAQAKDALQYGWPEGLAPVRAWIAERLVARGVGVEPEHVIVTAGAQQALALVAAELETGSQIAVGDATYPAALAAFTSAGLVPVARGSAAAHYVIAGVDNPYGIDTLEARRAELIASNAELIVDEAYAELRFDGTLPRPLAIDAPDRVWHVGTISKTLCPGLRIGWLVPPRRRRAAVLERKQASDLQTCTLSQVALSRLFGVIDYDATLAKARRRYLSRADRFTSALRRYAPALRFREPEGGFSIWIETDREGDDIALLEAAIDAGVSIDPGRQFRADAASSPIAFRLSFSNAPEAALEEGARRVAAAFEAWTSA
jgi:2-aminoadipate transaminase